MHIMELMVDKDSNNDLLNRITRDIPDGVIVLDMHGVVSFINPNASKLLEIDELRPNEKYHMLEDFREDNDDFFQFLLNAIYKTDIVHTGNIKYVTRKNHEKWFYISTSTLFSQDGKNIEGIVVQITDISEYHLLEQKAYDSAFVFVLLMAGVCLWSFVSLIWESLGQPISSSAMTMIVEGFGFIVFFILWRYTSITIKDMGLNIKGVENYIRIDFKYTMIFAVIMIVVKVVLLFVNPSMFMKKTLFNFDMFDWSCYMYPITVIAQEFLSRGVIHESIKRIIPGKYSDFWAIFVSSLFFGAIHIHKGILYMVGAFFLLSIFGLIYRKQKTIWGLCIPHFVLGTLLVLLFEM